MRVYSLATFWHLQSIIRSVLKLHFIRIHKNKNQFYDKIDPE